MKNQFYKFLIMLATVISVGSAATMLNLSMQKKSSSETKSIRPYAMMDQPQWMNETQEAVFQTMGETEAGTIASNEIVAESERLLEEPLEETKELESNQETYIDATEEPITQTISNEKQIYYARLQDMERVYTARMNAAATETLTVQQKTTEELLKIWDDELNVIYQRLRNALSEDEFHILRNEERAWIRNRDTAANQAAGMENYSSNARNLAYTRSLLQWTKERVYELAAMYYGK